VEEDDCDVPRVEERKRRKRERKGTIEREERITCYCTFCMMT